jgi:mono/diheme cytochrome c family protein
MTKRWVAGIFAISVGLGAVALYFGAGAYDMGADAPHWEVTRRAIELVRDRSIAAHAKNIDLPELQDEQLVSKGAGQYAAMCVNCHLAPGMKDSEIRPGLYPQPPNLSEQRIDPKRAFWVVKHGLKMSGMPAWGIGHDDDTIWSIVAFVTRLPGLSADHYKEMVANAPPDEEMGNMKMDDGKEPEDQKTGASKKEEPKGGHKH